MTAVSFLCFLPGVVFPSCRGCSVGVYFFLFFLRYSESNFVTTFCSFQFLQIDIKVSYVENDGHNLFITCFFHLVEESNEKMQNS